MVYSFLMDLYGAGNTVSQPIFIEPWLGMYVKKIMAGNTDVSAEKSEQRGVTCSHAEGNMNFFQKSFYFLY
jgi:hypothetical protein